MTEGQKSTQRHTTTFSSHKDLLPVSEPRNGYSSVPFTESLVVVSGNHAVSIDSAKGVMVCYWEGMEGRAIECKNNPTRDPMNYRPGVCDMCPTNPEAHKIAGNPLSPVYIDFKQRQEGKGNFIAFKKAQNGKSKA